MFPLTRFDGSSLIVVDGGQQGRSTSQMVGAFRAFVSIRFQKEAKRKSLWQRVMSALVATSSRYARRGVMRNDQHPYNRA